jgi:hypothetical protein
VGHFSQAPKPNLHYRGRVSRFRERSQSWNRSIQVSTGNPCRSIPTPWPPLPTGIKVSTASGASQGKGLDTIGGEMQALLQ